MKDNNEAKLELYNAKEKNQALESEIVELRN